MNSLSGCGGALAGWAGWPSGMADTADEWTSYPSGCRMGLEGGIWHARVRAARVFPRVAKPVVASCRISRYIGDPAAHGTHAAALSTGTRAAPRPSATPAVRSYTRQGRRMVTACPATASGRAFSQSAGRAPFTTGSTDQARRFLMSCRKGSFARRRARVAGDVVRNATQSYSSAAHPTRASDGQMSGCRFFVSLIAMQYGL